MTAPLNKVGIDIDLRDLLTLHKRDVMFDFNCHAIAQVTSFDSENQTITANMVYSSTYYVQSASGAFNAVQKEYPALIEMPAIFPSGGGCALTFPIAPGDFCVVLFNDRDINNWFSGATSGPPATGRLHSFADGLALVGFPEISNYDDVRALLSNGTVKLGINPVTNKVLISNGTSLNTLLQNLCTQLNDLTTALSVLTVTGVTGGPGTSGPPSNAAMILSIGVQIEDIATNLEGLLE